MDKQSFEMRMQAKSLEREAKRMQKEANKERTKAKAELRKGNRAAANLYAQNAVRYEQQANTLLQSCAATNGYATDIRQAQASVQMSTNMNRAVAGLQATTAQVDPMKISGQRTKLDAQRQKMATAHELLVGGEGETEIGAGAEDLLSQLEAETEQEAMGAAMDIPMGAMPIATPSNPQGIRN